MSKVISGFSKLNKEEKINWLVENFLSNDAKVLKSIKRYWNSDNKLQRLHDQFIENSISNFYLPYAIAPNFIINGETYTVPMAIEESSVVAAASLVAKFWSERGGFKAEVISTKKIGHVHFIYEGNYDDLKAYFHEAKSGLLDVTEPITRNMRKRGGGILSLELKDKTQELSNYYQLEVKFETKDSMGANFINTCLEAIAKNFQREDIEIVMSILSNYTPECLVKAEVNCKIEDFADADPHHYAQKFYNAVQIAKVEPFRAVTHNKGIMNGIDAVVIATGNDFRAVEACVHAHAAKSGQYRGLSNCSLEDDMFRFWIEIPLALGTVGGLTSLHPLAKLSWDILQHPSAEELMQIVAVAGLAQNFAALKALTTKGIQHGHMKMHIQNMLNQLGATEEEQETIVEYFKGKQVTYNLVADALQELKVTKMLK